MDPNSPMMHRVARHRPSFSLPVSIPRKGRIRIFLGLIVIALLIRFVPSIIRSTAQPKVSTSKSDRLLPAKKRASAKTDELFSRAIAKITKKPRNLAATYPLTYKGNDSLLVYTSIDTTLKKYLERLFNRYHPLYGAILALQPKTGRILAMVTYTHDTMPDLGANLCVKSLFPAASTFKTVTAAAAVEYADYQPLCTIEHRGKTSTLYRSQLKRELDWSVDITFAQAYYRSVNAAFARIGIYDVGREQLLATANDFGFNMPVPGDLPCERSVASCSDSLFELAELASGFNQKTLLSPLHGACIAAAIAEDGVMPTPTLIDSILDVKSGTLKYRARTVPWQRAMQPATAATMQTLMSSVVQYGTGRKSFRDIRRTAQFDDFSYGGKTGSVDKDGIGRVDWFIGFATHPQRIDEQIAVGVVTVHGEYWTVHSSYLASETMRYYLRTLQKAKKNEQQDREMVQSSDTATSSAGQ